MTKIPVDRCYIGDVRNLALQADRIGRQTALILDAA